MTYKIVGEIDAEHRVRATAPLEAPVGPVELILVTPELKNGSVAKMEAVETRGEEKTLDLEEIIERCKVNSGIGDLAHQHDHYLYGTPKKEPHD